MLTRLLITLLSITAVASAQHDLVIANGRVIDPETGLDAPLHLGIDDGAITAISATPLEGKETIDAQGLVVAPGFIDLHQHAWDPDTYRAKALDGVTTILELEVGTADIPKWYADRKGKLPIHHGVSIGHIPVRMKVFKEFPGFLPKGDSDSANQAATPETLEQLKAGLRAGLDAGAPAVGFGLGYTPGASHWEIVELFRVAAAYNASCHVHLRTKGEVDPGVVQALGEVLAAAAVSGAPLHVVHINSTGTGQTQDLLGMIGDARTRGLKVTVECYPYTAGMTDISAALFNPGFRERMSLEYNDLQWAATGERLTADTFEKYRATGGLVIVHTNPESIVTGAIQHPLTIIASDGLKGHPRNYGTYARILGKYVREDQALDLLTALKKITLMPARALEARVPAMRRKGRIQLDCDADLTLFDPATIIDQSTFTEPAIHSQGIHHLLVSGFPVVKDGAFLDEAKPGKAIRAPEGVISNQ